MKFTDGEVTKITHETRIWCPDELRDVAEYADKELKYCAIYDYPGVIRGAANTVEKLLEERDRLYNEVGELRAYIEFVRNQVKPIVMYSAFHRTVTSGL